MKSQLLFFCLVCFSGSHRDCGDLRRDKRAAQAAFILHAPRYAPQDKRGDLVLAA